MSLEKKKKPLAIFVRSIVAAGSGEWRKWIKSVCISYGRELVMGFQVFVCWGLLSVVSFRTNKPAGTWLYLNKQSENIFYTDADSSFLKSNSEELVLLTIKIQHCENVFL